MTTEAAERMYQAQHLKDMEGRNRAVYNPNNKPLEELPTIYGFNNGGSAGCYQALSVSDDGHFLGSHICSHECYMPNDLGILEGAREDRHLESYQKHYPDGYKMEFVGYSYVNSHECLLAALIKAKELNEEMKDPTQFASVQIETTSQ